jgi:hypothetical protein
MNRVIAVKGSPMERHFASLFGTKSHNEFEGAKYGSVAKLNDCATGSIGAMFRRLLRSIRGFRTIFAQSNGMRNGGNLLSFTSCGFKS